MTIDQSGRDDLMNAVIDRDVGTVARLLANGQDPNRLDNAGWSALHFAAQNNHAELAALLLANGASTSIVDLHGNTPLWRAVFSCRGAEECIKVLLEAGADPDQPNNHGVSPKSLAQTIANYDARTFFD